MEAGRSCHQFLPDKQARCWLPAPALQTLSPHVGQQMTGYLHVGFLLIALAGAALENNVRILVYKERSRQLLHPLLNTTSHRSSAKPLPVRTASQTFCSTRVRRARPAATQGCGRP